MEEEVYESFVYVVGNVLRDARYYTLSDTTQYVLTASLKSR